MLASIRKLLVESRRPICDMQVGDLIEGLDEDGWKTVQVVRIDSKAAEISVKPLSTFVQLMRERVLPFTDDAVRWPEKDETRGGARSLITYKVRAVTVREVNRSIRNPGCQKSVV